MDRILEIVDDNLEELRKVNPSLAEQVDSAFEIVGTTVVSAVLISTVMATYPILKILIYFNKKYKKE